MPHRHNRRSSLRFAIHHVMARGDDRQAIVSRKADRLAFVAHLRDVAEAQDIAIHAYCLMDNHYHLILEAPWGDLAPAINHLRQWNEEHVSWRFKSIPVEADRYLAALSRYLHRNPVRACLATHPACHRWSTKRGQIYFPPRKINLSPFLRPFLRLLTQY